MEDGTHTNWRQVIHHIKYFSLSDPALTHKHTHTNSALFPFMHQYWSDTAFKSVLSNDTQRVYKYPLEKWMWEPGVRWFGSFCTNILWSSSAPVYFSEIFMSWICFSASIEWGGNLIHYTCDGLCIMPAIGVMNIKRSVLFFRQSISGLPGK